MKRISTLMLSAAVVVSASAVVPKAISSQRATSSAVRQELRAQITPAIEARHAKQAGPALRAAKTKLAAPSPLFKAPKAENDPIVLADVSFTFLTEGSATDPVAIELDEYNNIPESLIGAENYGWGGVGLYQGGGAIYCAYADMEGELWGTDMDAKGIITVSFEARTAEDGTTDSVFVGLYDWENGWISYNYDSKITSEWQSFTVELSALDASDEGYYPTFYQWDGEDFLLRNVKITAVLPAVAAPTALDYTDFTGTSFTANWTAVEDATAYKLYVAQIDLIWDEEEEYSYEQTGDYIIDGVEVEGTSYKVDIEPGVLYDYWVVAYNGEDSSVPSNKVRVAQLATPENVTGKLLDDKTGFEIEWDAVPAATEYMVQAKRVFTTQTAGVQDIAAPDFATIESEGTVEAPVESDYVIETPEQMPGWIFVLPQYANGAMGVQSFWLYEWFGYVAQVQSGALDLSAAKDGIVTVSMEVASGLGSGFAAAILAADEDGDYSDITDEYDYNEALTSEFKTITFTLEGATDDCVIVIMPFNPDSESDAESNIFFKNITVTCETEAGAKIGYPLGSTGSTETYAVFETPIEENNVYYARVAPLMYDEYDNFVMEGNYSEYTPINNHTGVQSLLDDNTGALVRYYNLQGIEIAKPQAGSLYIRTEGSKASKVIL